MRSDPRVELISEKEVNVDLSDYYTKSEVEDLIPIIPPIPDQLADLTEDATHRLVTDAEKTTWNAKQNALQSGVNIKTINSNNILGSGNIEVGGATESFAVAMGVAL